MKHLREELLKPTMSAPGFEFFSKDIKLKTLISEPQYDTCKFIAKGMELREFLVSKPRNNDWLGNWPVVFLGSNTIIYYFYIFSLLTFSFT